MSDPLRFLILEDNPADAELAQFELQAAGISFTSKVVMTEDDFVRQIQEYRPDLILSDYDLPQYTGALALAESKRRCPDTPFILVTGAVTEDRAIDILTQGAKDYVLKNRLNQRLVPAVKRALAEAEEHRARKQAEAELREAHKDLEEKVKIRTTKLEADLTALTRMHDISSKILEPDGLGSMLQGIMDAAVAIVAAEKGTLQMVVGDSLHIVAHVNHDRAFLDFFAAAENVTSVCGDATKRGERVIVEDVEASPLFAGTPSLSVLRKAGVRAVQSTPLISRKGKLLGILTTQWGVPHVPDEHGLWRIDLLARQAADMIDQMQTTMVLQDSEKRYRRLFESAKDGIMILDADTGKVDDVNPFLLQLLGYSYDALCGKHIWEIGVFKDIVASRAAFKTLQENEYIRYDDLPLETSDGRPIAVEFVSNVYLVDHHKVVQCNIRDITEQKLVQEALRGSEDRFRLVLLASSIGTFEVDLLTGEGQWNATEFELLGLKPGEVVANPDTFFRFVHPDDVERLRNEWVEATRSGKLDAEFRIVRADGRECWLAGKGSFIFDGHPDGGDTGTGGKPRRFLGVNFDITERRQAEKALAVAHRQIQSIIDNTTAIIYAFDLEERFLLANTSLAELFNSAPERMIGKRRHEFMPKEDADWHEANDRQVIELGRAQEFEEYSQLKDRSITWLTTKFPLRDTQGKIYAVAGNSVDISERKRAEEALRESEYFFRESQRIANIGSYRLDISSGVWLSSEVLDRIFGISEAYPHTVPGWLELIHADDQGMMGSYFEEEVLGRGENFDKEYRIVRRSDGDTRWVQGYGQLTSDASGVIISMAGTVQDITDRKQYEEALRQGEEQFRNFFEHLTIGVAVYEAINNGEDFVFVEMNPAGQGLSKVSIDVIRGKRLSETFPGVKDLGLFQALQNVWRTGVPEYLPFNLYKDGRIQEWVENRVFKLPSGKIAAVYDDQTERMYLEEELRQAQKMESVGRLAGGVAHDFNNMLSVILGNTDILLEDFNPEQPLYVNLKEIKEAAQRSAEVTRQLLAFARKQTIAPKVIDLNEMIENIFKMLRRLIGEDIELLYHPGKELWPVKMDPAQLDQILANLSANARDAIISEGRLIIETSNITIDKTYCDNHLGFTTGDFVQVAFTDNGCGMDQETLKNLFEPFFTTKDMGKGTGLGLATVYGIVKQNNGFINVYSEPNKGTSFKIYLPRHKVSNEEKDVKAKTNATLHGNESILIVEDEISILKMTEQMLKRLGYSVLAANRPKDAINLAREHNGEIHLLLTDVIMPEMNGQDLLKNLLPIYPNLKSLFMSGYTANVIAHHGVLDEGVNYIQKPFSKQELSVKLRRVLDDADS